MKIVRFAPVLFLFIMLIKGVSGQIPMESWRGHFPFRNSHTLIETGNSIHCATDIGFYTYNRKTSQLSTFTTINGLNDVFISTMNRIADTEKLIIGYENGNIDIIDNGRVRNFPMIKEAPIQGNKAIRDVYFHQKKAFMSTGMGIVVFDPEKQEILETYTMTPESGNIVYAMTANTDYFYTATQTGVYRAPGEGVNLMDYRNWQKIEELPPGRYVSIAAFSGTIVTVRSNKNGNSEAYSKNGNEWAVMSPAVEKPRKVNVSNGRLYVTEKRKVHTFNKNLQLVDTYTSYGFATPEVNDILIDKDGNMWLADDYFGLVKRKPDAVEMRSPNGPAYRFATDIAYTDDLMLAAGGSKEARFSQRGMYYFTNGEWSTINHFNHEKLTGVHNLTYLAVDPHNPRHFFAASWGYGLVEFSGNEILNVYNENNSPMTPIQPYGHGYLNLAGLDFDSQGTLWVSSTATMQPVYGLTREGEWILPDVSGFNFGSNRTVGDLIVTDNDHIWMALPNKGFFVIGPEGRKKMLDFEENNGERIDAEITTIAEDKDGAIWVGTTGGIAVYYNPGYIFEQSNLAASRIIVNNTYLLKYDAVTDIYVDGGNRKWIATGSSGAILLSENGKEQLKQFTKSNSPLPSNTVTAIGINEKNGEVFFGTDAGTVSFRGDAREGEASFDDVYVYPNPVRENYEGPITIDGLMPNTLVKITDVAGNLVYQGESEGAVFTWDGKRQDNKRVNTGVYLVFCASPDGEFSKVTKFLVVQN